MATKIKQIQLKSLAQFHLKVDRKMSEKRKMFHIFREKQHLSKEVKRFDKKKKKKRTLTCSAYLLTLLTQHVNMIWS